MCDGSFDNVCSRVLVCAYCGVIFEGHGDEEFCSSRCADAQQSDDDDDRWDD